jgi:hypothetical protein
MLLLTMTAAKHTTLYFLEHPEDPGEPHPTWWITDQCAAFIRNVGGTVLSFDACRLGQIIGKATSALTNMPDMDGLEDFRCECSKRHESRDDYSDMARWPWELMIMIARALGKGLLTDHRVMGGPQGVQHNNSSEQRLRHPKRPRSETALASTEKEPKRRYPSAPAGRPRMSEVQPRPTTQQADEAHGPTSGHWRTY